MKTRSWCGLACCEFMIVALSVRTVDRERVFLWKFVYPPTFSRAFIADEGNQKTNRSKWQRSESCSGSNSVRRKSAHASSNFKSISKRRKINLFLYLQSMISYTHAHTYTHTHTHTHTHTRARARAYIYRVSQ